MKAILAVTLTLIFLPTECVSTQLPTEIRQQLDRKFSHWKLAVVEQEIHTFLKQSHARPDLIQGDFDGNGQIDYALYIVYGQQHARKTSVVALLRFKIKVKMYLLESHSAGDESIPSIGYLALQKKGARDYDYHKDEQFHYPHDSIFVGIFEKAGVSYVYGKGRFRQIITSD